MRGGDKKRYIMSEKDEELSGKKLAGSSSCDRARRSIFYIKKVVHKKSINDFFMVTAYSYKKQKPLILQGFSSSGREIRTLDTTGMNRVL